MTAAPVLVAHASQHSATAEIAERIAAAMREAGCAAEAQPASEVRDLSGYRAVVLGSAIYAKHWRPEARSFARRHAAALRELPVWLSAAGPSARSRSTRPRQCRLSPRSSRTGSAPAST
jgi:menaquinone-dependent protoporphyrinogen oxidase